MYCSKFHIYNVAIIAQLPAALQRLGTGRSSSEMSTSGIEVVVLVFVKLEVDLGRDIRASNRGSRYRTM